MLSKIFSSLFGRAAPAQSVTPPDAAAAQRRDFERLNAVAPVAATDPATAEGEAMARSFLCREAVLNGEQRVAGYEFQLRKGARERVKAQSRRINHLYNEMVVRNIVQFSIRKLLGQRLAFVPVLDSFLGSPVLRELPPEGVVLSLERGEGEGPELETIARQIGELRAAGYALAFDVCFDEPNFLKVAPLADYFVLDTTRHSPADIRNIAARLAQLNGRAVKVAKELQTYEDFLLCQKLGFGLFQGPFVTRREDWTANEVGPQSVRVCDLLNRLRRDADSAELGKVLRQDAMLSYRLLRYFNSAAFAQVRKVTSVEQALTMMGRLQLYRWLTLLLFGSAQDAPQAAALQEGALVRGRLMELAGQGRMSAADQENLFVTGLFSMLDLVLRVPLEMALQPLELPEDISSALLRREGPHAPYLELALASESFDQDRLATAAAACGLDAETVNALQGAALAWAQAIEM